MVDAGLNVVDATEAVRVSGFTVEGYPDAGIRVRGTRGAVLYNNVLSGNSIGIFESLSTGSRYTSNAISSGIDGILIQGSSGPSIHGNVIFDNTDGVVVTSSAGGEIASNNLHDNCEGVLLFFGATRWTVASNTANHNNKACAPTPASPPVSGVGIAIVGAHENVVYRNQIFDNRPTGPTIAAGGIVLDTFSASGPRRTTGSSPT